MLIHVSSNENDYIINTDHITHVKYNEYECTPNLEIQFVNGEFFICGKEAKRVYELLFKRSLYA